MSSWYQRQIARRQGSAAAISELARLAVSPEDQVDVFRIIEDARVWLLFEPLGRLYGFFERVRQTPGIVIHSGHPRSLQRYTAAHEYGHFLLGHQRSVDSAEELFGLDVHLQEIAAQAFAADFLMPLALVNRALDRLGLARPLSPLTALDAYQVALELGSSYRATLSQLAALNLIGGSHIEELRRHQPSDLKVEAGGRPQNARSDVWLVQHEGARRRVRMQVEDELHLRLPEVPTSGYRWQFGIQGGKSLVATTDRLLANDLRADAGMGRLRQRDMAFRAVAAGTVQLEIWLMRPWEADAVPAERMALDVTVLAPRAGATGVGISRRQGLPLLEAA